MSISGRDSMDPRQNFFKENAFQSLQRQFQFRVHLLFVSFVVNCLYGTNKYVQVLQRIKKFVIQPGDNLFLPLKA